MGSSSHTSKIKRGKDAVALDIIAYGFCGIIALVCLVPFIMIVSGSFSSESAIIQNGFSLLPQDFSLEAYKTVFKDPMVVFRAYGTTIGLTIVGTVLGLLLQTMTAYVLSRKEFEWRNQFSFFFYFTTLFSGGLVPYYVLMTQTLNLRDSYLALLLPLLFSVYNLLIMKSYIVGLPDSLIEAAKIDGANAVRAFFSITLPNIAKTVLSISIFFTMWRVTNFELVYAMTSGGPHDGTAVLAYKILIEAFNNLNLGYASAIAVVLSVIMLILSGLNVAVSKKYLK